MTRDLPLKFHLSLIESIQATLFTNLQLEAYPDIHYNLLLRLYKFQSSTFHII